MSDSWCSPLEDLSGRFLFGGAARNVRIARSGGMDKIIDEVAREAAANAYKRAEAAVEANNVISRIGRRAKATG